MLLNIEGSYLRCKTAHKCQKVHEQVEMLERNKYCPSLPLLSREVSVFVKET